MFLAAEMTRSEPRLHVTCWFPDESGTWSLKRVGVFVYWAGFMADLPMRNKLYKNLSWAASHACERCTLVGTKQKKQAMKFKGYALLQGDNHVPNGLQFTMSVQTHLPAGAAGTTAKPTLEISQTRWVSGRQTAHSRAFMPVAVLWH